MRTPVSLATVRSAISKSQRTSFCYEGMMMLADLYLLGQAKKTGAFIVIAWCIQPARGWCHLRYSLMRDFETKGTIDGVRDDFDPYDAKIVSIDTQIFRPRARRVQA